MSTSLEDIKDSLKSEVRFQQTPSSISEDDYRGFVKKGTQRLYVDSGKEENFANEYYEEVADGYNINAYLTRDLTLTEKEYILLSSIISFKRQIRDDVNNLVSYSTDALSITGADRPYRNLSSDIQELESRLSILSYKFEHK